jgi:hypothetical protein
MSEQETPTEKPVQPISEASAPAKLQGGAKVSTQKPASAVPEGPEDGFEVVSTALGTRGSGGIVPVGTRFKISDEAYSPAWMKPVFKKDEARAAKAAAMKDEQRKELSERRQDAATKRLARAIGIG